MPPNLMDMQPMLTRDEVRAREAERRKLLQRLDAKRATIRIEAVEACQRMSPHEISILVALAERTDEWRFPQKVKWAAGGFVLLAALASLYATVYGRERPEYALLPNLALYIGMWVSLITVCVIIHSRYLINRYSLRVRESLQQVVCTAQDPAIFPVLLRMLSNWRGANENASLHDSELYKTAVRWLAVLSPTQIRSYAVRHQSLYLFLTSGRAWQNPDAALRVLGILAEIGTPGAIPVVMPLTRGLVPYSRQNEIRQAAQTCLATLQQRERQQRQPEFLLRAASAPAVQNEALLRATSAPGVPSETLLRPQFASPTSVSPEQLLRSTEEPQSASTALAGEENGENTEDALFP